MSAEHQPDRHGDEPGRRTHRGRHGDGSSPDEPIENPGLPGTLWRPTDVDPRPRSAPSGRSPACSGSPRSARCSSSSPTSPSRSTAAPTARSRRSSASAPPTSPWAPSLGGALLFIGIGIIQWARKLMGDHEIVEMRHPARSSDEDREETVAGARPGRRGVRHRPAPAGPQLAARRGHRPARARGGAAARPRPDQRAGHRGRRLPRRRASSTPSGTRACGSCATSSAPRSAPRDLEIGDLRQRRARDRSSPSTRRASRSSRASRSRSPSPRAPSS